jgi:hypothetical protein
VSAGYFHWLTEALAKLHLICTSFGKCNILLPKEYEGLRFVSQSLNAFPEASISYVPDGKSISVPCLKLISPVAPVANSNPQIVNELRSRLVYYLGAHDIDNDSCTRAETGVYVSRAKATKRRIVNETTVVNVIKDLGYQIVSMEDLSFSRQVKLMQGAKVLLGTHGAGLTNMLFMPVGSAIVEIRKEGDARHNHFFALASALGHRYYYMTAQGLPIRLNGSEYFSEDLFVDVARLLTLLQQVAKDRSSGCPTNTHTD